MNSCMPPHVYFIQPVNPNTFFLVLALSLQFLAAEEGPFLHCLTRPRCFPSDIDECALPTTCPWGTCTNTEGSFLCITCQPGFTVSEDGQRCEGEAFSCVSTEMCLCCSKQVRVCVTSSPGNRSQR